MDGQLNCWLSTIEVATRLKIPPKTLANWASAGKGPRFAKIGRYRRYHIDDLTAWEQAMLTRGGGTRIQIADNNVNYQNDPK